MGMEPGKGSAGLAEAKSMSLREAAEAICYPEPRDSRCTLLIESLEAEGIKAVISYGRLCLDCCCILGRGWAGTVFLALHRSYGLVAVKALRPGSRRRTMLPEAMAWGVAAAVGAAPPLLAATTLYILYKPVIGPQLGEYKPRNWQDSLRVASILLDKLWLLDRVGVRHTELARPGDHVIIDSESLEPFIIDYDSATLGKTGYNLPQFLGGAHRTPLFKDCKGKRVGALRETLRAYKRGGLGDPTLFARLKKLVLLSCITANPP